MVDDVNQKQKGSMMNRQNPLDPNSVPDGGISQGLRKCTQPPHEVANTQSEHIFRLWIDSLLFYS